MIKAADLIKEQEQREIKKNLIYDKIYNLIEKKIILASTNNNYYIWYEMPEILIGIPLYSIKKCQEYIQNKLKANGFDTDFFPPNILLIKWFPQSKALC